MNISWKKFEQEAPHLATLGYNKLHRKISYLAILKKDGSPRLHPVTPFIGHGMLFIFTEPTSPKIGDLRRDGRYALHCSVGGGGPLVEVLISGQAREITNSDQRSQAENIASSPVVLASYVLFEFMVDRALVVEYDSGGKQIIRRWKSK